mgnify:FL=1
MKLTDKKVRDGLNFIYKEYENNIVSKEEIFDYVRDVHYIDSTGMTYQKWLEENQPSKWIQERENY